MTHASLHNSKFINMTRASTSSLNVLSLTEFLIRGKETAALGTFNIMLKLWPDWQKGRQVQQKSLFIVPPPFFKCLPKPSECSIGPVNAVSIVTSDHEQRVCSVEIGDIVVMELIFHWRLARQVATCKLFFVKREMLLKKSFIPGLLYTVVKCESWSGFLRPSTTIPSFYTGGHWGSKRLNYCTVMHDANWQVWFSNCCSFLPFSS